MSAARIAGGLVTRDDLDSILPAIIPAEEVPLRGAARRAAFVPWRESVITQRSEPSLPGTHTQVVAAVDHRGLVAVACYERREVGVAIDALGVVAPFVAAPVLRGQTRVRPGTPIATCAPVALVRTSEDAALDMTLAVSGDPDAEHALGAALDAWSSDATELAPAYAGPGALIGLIRTSGSISLLARRG